MKVDCPKCGSHAAWYERDNQDLTLRCMCGYRKLVHTAMQVDDHLITIEHNDFGDTVVIPRPGSRLRDALNVLAAEGQATSKEVAERLVLMGKDYSVAVVSSYLALMKSRGLIEVVLYSRGIAGGSTWKLTDRAKELLGLPKE